MTVLIKIKIKGGSNNDKVEAGKLADRLRSACCDRSTTEKIDCGRRASWSAVIRPSEKI
jgi:hypothetical protein